MEHLRIPVGDLTFDALATGPGDGRPVLFLHGFPENSTMWQAPMTALGADGYRCVAPDQRGYSPGARPAQVADYATSALARDVVGTLDHFGWDRVDLVGHDWGAGVAWRVAAEYPDRLRTLNVLSVGNPDAISQVLQAGTGDQRGRSSYIQFFTRPDSAERLLADDAALLRMTYRGWGDGAGELDDYVEYFSTPGTLDAALSWYRAMGANPAAGTRIITPTLYIWSDGDPALGREGAEATRDWVTGPYRFVELAGVSHWVVQEAGDRVLSELQSHLAGH